MRYVKKPVEIEAVQWNGLNLNEIIEFVGDKLQCEIYDEAWRLGQAPPTLDMKIHTLEGDMEVSEGDYIIKGVKGEFYPCKPDIFEETYSPVFAAVSTDIEPESLFAEPTYIGSEITRSGSYYEKRAEAIKDIRMNDKYVTFWGSCFSNFYPTSFWLNDHEWNCSEQYFMWMKATVFNDKETAEKILACTNAKDAKKLGRQVQGFDDKLWNLCKVDVMKKAVQAKFEQNALLFEIIQDPMFQGKHFVEGNPYDKVWSVGLNWTSPDIFDENKWQGENLLGKILDEVRDNLLESTYAALKS